MTFKALEFESPQQWLEHYAIPVTESGCWLYEGSVKPDGYGAIHSGRVHRVSYKKFYGSIPKGFYVCHKCDVPSCINPKHLFLGTQFDNMVDMHRKGRGIGKSLGPLSFNGETLGIGQWAKRLGLSSSGLRSRVNKHGMELALSMGGAYASVMPKSRCDRGHELKPAAWNPKRKVCRICQSIGERKYHAKLLARRAAMQAWMGRR